MLTLNQIRQELKDIRYYYSRKNVIDKCFEDVGKSNIINVVNKYHNAICSAPIKLYDLYVSLYVNNNTQEVLADDMSYTPEYIQKQHVKLIKFFQTNLPEEENTEKGD